MHIIYLHKNIISIKYGLARENIRANTSGKCRREDSSKPDHIIVSDTQTKTRVNTHTNIYIHIYTQIFGHFKNTKRGNQPGEHTHTDAGTHSFVSSCLTTGTSSRCQLCLK